MNRLRSLKGRWTCDWTEGAHQLLVRERDDLHESMMAKEKELNDKYQGLWTNEGASRARSHS